MASDVKFAIEKATADQVLAPATVSEELEQSFLKKEKSSSIKMIPISFVVSVVVIGIAVLLVVFLKRFVISFIGLVSVVYPIYAIYDAVATSKAIKNHDYGFFYGEIISKNDSGAYQVKGLEGHDIPVLLGKKDYSAGDKVIVARVKDDLNIVAEE